MSIQKLLLYLYPRIWRDRYGEEFLVVFASHPFSLFEGIDVIRGAFDAHLHPRLGTTALPASERMRKMLSTLRDSLLTIFCAYTGFIMAGMGFQKMTEDAAFQQAGQAVMLVGLSFHLVVIGAVVALLTVLIGGLPIAVAVIRSALVRKRYRLVLWLSVPLLACAALLLTTWLVKAIDHPGVQPVWHLFLNRGTLLGVLIAAFITSAGALCQAVIHSEIPEKLLHFAVLPSILVTFSMALILAATLTWGLVLGEAAPQFFTGNGGLVGTSTISSWLGIVIIMTMSTGLSTVSLLRGLSARFALYNAAL